ncbi:hypothetical protein HAX54_004032 [Datura stramonium]|uniref:Uncharacterized protein n=1 Tax=Datura stramonium TaxID=4076 RepID=A0ABS8T7M5_DATST|nr:hypothetical protein [Datura stramonium]
MGIVDGEYIRGYREEIPLWVRLNGVATFIGIVGLAVAIFVLIVLYQVLHTGNSKIQDGTTQFVRGQTSVSKTMDGVVHIITAAVTIVVVAVPEGLPLAVTLTVYFKDGKDRGFRIPTERLFFHGGVKIGMKFMLSDHKPYFMSLLLILQRKEEVLQLESRVALKFICIGRVQLKLYWHHVPDTLTQVAACNPLKGRRIF